MNQIENAFAPPETCENHPITEESKKGSKILGEIKDNLKKTIGGGNGSDSEKQEEHGESDKIANAEAYANAQFEAEYQSAKDKAREEMKEQMCPKNKYCLSDRKFNCLFQMNEFCFLYNVSICVYIFNIWPLNGSYYFLANE